MTLTTIDHRFSPGDRLLVNWCGIHVATFLRYRTAEEMADWRPDDNCFIKIDRDFSPGRVFPSDELVPIGEATCPE